MCFDNTVKKGKKQSQQFRRGNGDQRPLKNGASSKGCTGRANQLTPEKERAKKSETARNTQIMLQKETGTLKNGQDLRSRIRRGFLGKTLAKP